MRLWLWCIHSTQTFNRQERKSLLKNLKAIKGLQVNAFAYMSVFSTIRTQRWGRWCIKNSNTSTYIPLFPVTKLRGRKITTKWWSRCRDIPSVVFGKESQWKIHHSFHVSGVEGMASFEVRKGWKSWCKWGSKVLSPSTTYLTPLPHAILLLKIDLQWLVCVCTQRCVETMQVRYNKPDKIWYEWYPRL